MPPTLEAENTNQPVITVRPTLSPSTEQPTEAAVPIPNERVANPAFQPLASNGLTGQPVAQYQPSAQPAMGFSYADALARENKKTHKKKLLVGSAIFVGVIALAIIGVSVYSLLFGFKTITYDNGVGSKFKLSFDSRYSTNKVFSPSGQSTGANPNLLGLYSHKSQNGKAPLTMFISSSELTTANQTRYANNNGCARLPVAFTVHNDYLKKDLNICAIKQNNIDIMYIAVFTDTSKFYAITIGQAIDFQKASSSKQAAQSALDSAGLDVYQGNIQKIIASIRPIN